MTIDSGVREEALLSMAYLTSPQVSVPQFLESMTTSNQRTLTPRSLLTGTVIRRYFPSMDNGPTYGTRKLYLSRGGLVPRPSWERDQEGGGAVMNNGARDLQQARRE